MRLVGFRAVFAMTNITSLKHGDAVIMAAAPPPQACVAEYYTIDVWS